MGILTFQYDPVGDILTVQTCPSYAEQETEELEDEVLARLNPESGNVEMLEILFFRSGLSSSRWHCRLWRCCSLWRDEEMSTVE